MATEIDEADNNGNTCCFAKFFPLTEHGNLFSKFLGRRRAIVRAHPRPFSSLSPDISRLISRKFLRQLRVPISRTLRDRAILCVPKEI